MPLQKYIYTLLVRLGRRWLAKARMMYSTHRVLCVRLRCQVIRWFDSMNENRNLSTNQAFTMDIYTHTHTHTRDLFILIFYASSLPRCTTTFSNIAASFESIEARFLCRAWLPGSMRSTRAQQHHRHLVQLFWPFPRLA